MNDVSSLFSPTAAQKTADQVRSELTKSVQHCFNACELLADAKASLRTAEFQQLPELIGLSKSTIYKMVKVGESDRIKSHIQMLAKVGGWSVLHKITTLDEKQFQVFEGQYLTGTQAVQIERRHVDQVAKGNLSGTRATARNPAHRSFAKIRIDMEKLRDCADIGDELESLKNTLNELGSNSLLSIDFGDSIDRIEEALDKQFAKEANALMKSYWKEAEAARRKAYNEELKSLPAGQKNERGFTKKWSYNKTEFFNKEVHPNEALELLGWEPVHADKIGVGKDT